MCPGVQVLCLSLTPTVRGGFQGPVTCSVTAHSTACIPCNLLHANGPCVIQSWFIIIIMNCYNCCACSTTLILNTYKSFVNIWPLRPRMRLVCGLGLFVALLHVSSALLLGAFNIKSFGDKKSSNTTLMNIISTVWNCILYPAFLFS